MKKNGVWVGDWSADPVIPETLIFSRGSAPVIRLNLT
jgi:hypothetical protein